MSNDVINKAIKVLRGGGVIAYPTEGVWGLGCDPYNADAVQRLLELKQRDPDKGLILVAANMEQVSPLLKGLNAEQMELLHSTWPGAHTWLLPDSDQFIPSWIKGKFATVALRVSDHSTVVELCNGFSGLLVSTSANPVGLPPAKTQAEVEDYFGKALDFIVPGRLGAQDGPSVIQDLLSASTLRR